MSDESGGSPLWDFTSRHYPSEGVQPSVIALQDGHGADVNILFYCCYAAAIGERRLGRADFEKAAGAITDWKQAITEPLRRLRDCIKQDAALSRLAGAAAVRGKILGAEIESEKVAQRILCSLLASPRPIERASPERLATAAANLEGYLRYLSVPLDRDVLQSVTALLRGTFPSCSPADIGNALARR